MCCRYFILVLAVIVPFFGVANAYGTGLTDFDMSSVYGTVSLSQTPPLKRKDSVHKAKMLNLNLFSTCAPSRLLQVDGFWCTPVLAIKLCKCSQTP